MAAAFHQLILHEAAFRIPHSGADVGHQSQQGGFSGRGRFKFDLNIKTD